MHTIFSSILTFALGLFFTFCGLIALLVVWFPTIRSGLFNFLAHSEILLSIFGATFLSMGISIIVYTLMFTSRRYFYIRSGPREVSISEEIAKEYVSKYFQKLFLQKDLPSNLHVKRGKIFISANLPYIPEEEQYSLTQKIDSELSDILYYKLGYKAQYYLSISFEGEPRTPKESQVSL